MNLAKAHVKIDSTKVAYTVKEEIKKDVEAKIITSVYAAVMLALHEDNPKAVWGKKRLSDLQASAEKRLDEYTLEELKHRVKAKIGIELEDEK